MIRKSWVALICTACCLISVQAYYTRWKCYGTGDCLMSTGYMGGGFTDEYHRWLIECNDGEAMIGVYDAAKQFLGISQIWCYFMFPLKPPGNGIYPYYPGCNVRNYSQLEYYCYDKHFPQDTVDTFVVGFYSSVSYDPVNPTLQKCCKTPTPYRLDYTRCEWKYTHDKLGEHYDGWWIVKCDTYYVMTGMGMAMSPFDNQLHYVWIQCCPVLTIVPDTRNNSYGPLLHS